MIKKTQLVYRFLNYGDVEHLMNQTINDNEKDGWEVKDVKIFVSEMDKESYFECFLILQKDKEIE